MNITPEQIALLEANGWTIECQSPLEISHDEGSRATGLAACYALPEILADLAQQNVPVGAVEQESDYSVFQELMKLIKQARSHVEVARTTMSAGASHDAWSIAYNLVFNEKCSGRILALLKRLRTSLDYYDPDSSYEDDVVAYVCAVEARGQELQPFMDALAPE